MPTTPEQPDYEAIGKEMRYEDKVRAVFRDIATANDGASPAEVYLELMTRGWLAPTDTVLDIIDLMRKLRSEGFL